MPLRDENQNTLFYSVTRVTKLGKSLSSNLNDVIRAILDFFIYEKVSQAQKARNAYKQTKIKNTLKKHLRGKKSLIRFFAFLYFCLGAFVPFGAFGAFGACKIFL